MITGKTGGNRKNKKKYGSLLILVVLLLAQNTKIAIADDMNPGAPQGSSPVTIPILSQTKVDQVRTLNRGYRENSSPSSLKGRNGKSPSPEETSATVRELGDTDSQVEFLQQISDIRKKIMIRTLKKKLSEIGSGEEDLNGSPISGAEKRKRKKHRVSEEAVVKRPVSHARIVGRSGNRVVARINGKTVEMNVGATRDGYKVIIEGGIPVIVPTNEHSSREGSLHNTTGLIHGKSQSSTILSKLKLVGTSHFYARISYKESEREVGIGSIVASRYKVQSIGRGQVVLEDIKNGQTLQLEQAVQPETLPTGLNGRYSQSGFTPPPPGFPQQQQGFPPAQKLKQEEDY